MTLYSLTNAGYRAWLDDGNKGSYSEFLMTQTTREKAINLIQDKIKYLSTRDLFALIKHINKNYPYILK